MKLRSSLKPCRKLLNLVSGKLLTLQIIRENREWLRYVFWFGAAGLAWLAFQIAISPDQDAFKMIVSILGVLLFSFCGFVFKTHKVVFDQHQNRIVLTHKGFRSASEQVIPFSDISHIVIVKTFHYDEDLSPANRWQERWHLALGCRDEIVPLTYNPSVRKDEARQLAQEIQSILRVDILDSDQESLNALLKIGWKAQAITLAARSQGITITEASQHVSSLK